MLKKYYTEKWKNSDIYRDLKEKLYSESVFINNIIIDKYDSKTYLTPFRISKNLFTNKDIIEILNYLGIKNDVDESYLIINPYNKSLPIKFNEKGNAYISDNSFLLRPVSGITWDGALFIANLFDGRLPYEKEWMISASAGNKEYKFPWGNKTPSSEFANYEEYYGKTTPIEFFPPNEIGIYDMAGNVEEWCMDKGTESRDGIVLTRKVKGGCWYKSSKDLEINSYREHWCKMSSTGIGFRIVWEEKNG